MRPTLEGSSGDSPASQVADSRSAGPSITAREANAMARAARAATGRESPVLFRDHQADQGGGDGVPQIERIGSVSQPLQRRKAWRNGLLKRQAPPMMVTAGGPHSQGRSRSL